jgi:VWFA-related protein
MILRPRRCRQWGNICAASGLVCMALVLVGGQVQRPTFRVESNVVSVPALVLDQNNEPVFGLTAADFAIEDNGKPQDVALDETVDDTPVSIVVAVQVGRTAPAEFPRIRALATMLEPIMARGNTRVALVTFDSQVNQLNDFTTESSDLSASLKKLRPGDNGAAILHAIRYSVLLLEGEPEFRRRVLLLVSETRDHGNRTVDLNEVLRDIASSNTLVYCLAFGPALSNVLDDLRGKLQPDPNSMSTVNNYQVLNWGYVAVKLGELARQGMRRNIAKALARLTGGEYELFKSENGFQNYMNTFTNHLYSRYLLYFTPKDPQPGLHLLTVRLRNSGTLKVISRPTYWAPDRTR